MQQHRISGEDERLVEAARDLIDRYYEPGRHHVGAAVRTKSGRVFSAVHLEANVGRVAVCAEAIALGKAISEGERDFDSIVAVMRSDEADEGAFVVSPCGMCRELISDYGADTEVIHPGEGGLRKAPVLDLIPAKFVRRSQGEGEVRAT